MTNHPNRNIKNRLRARIVPEPGATMPETWLTAQTPCGEPLTIIMSELCERYAKIYRESVTYTNNDFRSWVRHANGLTTGKPLPKKIEALMQSELIYHALSLDLGEDLATDLCRYLGLPE